MAPTHIFYAVFANTCGACNHFKQTHLSRLEDYLRSVSDKIQYKPIILESMKPDEIRRKVNFSSKFQSMWFPVFVICKIDKPDIPISVYQAVFGDSGWFLSPSSSGPSAEVVSAWISKTLADNSAVKTDAPGSVKTSATAKASYVPTVVLPSPVMRDSCSGYKIYHNEH